jgi:hypothetical protein
MRRGNTLDREDDSGDAATKGIMNAGPTQCTGAFACTCPVCIAVVQDERRAAVVEASVRRGDEMAE